MLLFGFSAPRAHNKHCLCCSTLALLTCLLPPVQASSESSTPPTSAVGNSLLQVKTSGQFGVDPVSAETSSPFLQVLDDPNAILTAKFYVYDDLDWMSMRCAGFSVAELLGDNVYEGGNGVEDDFFFMKSALRHPLRTLNPNEAVLFVVPALLNTLGNFMPVQALAGKCVNRTGNCNCCVRSTERQLCNEDLLTHTERLLEQSSWFQRGQGRDHVIVCSAPSCSTWRQPYKE